MRVFEREIFLSKLRVTSVSAPQRARVEGDPGGVFCFYVVLQSTFGGTISLRDTPIKPIVGNQDRNKCS